MKVLQELGTAIASRVGPNNWLVRGLRPLYETVLHWSAAGKGIPWSINGVTFRVDPRYRHRLGHEYDVPVAGFLRQRVLPGAVCVDIGANVGVYVLQFAHWSHPDGHVIAFEPNPHARRVLERHIRMNGLLERVDVVPAAVGDASGSADLYVRGADGRSRLGSPNPEVTGDSEATRVMMTTLDEYCHTHRISPDWIFIDIEGFEMAALAGARKVVQTRGSALGIIVEMHPSVWDSAGATRDEFEALVTGLGRHAVSLTGQVDPLGEHGLVLLAS